MIARIWHEAHRPRHRNRSPARCGCGVSEAKRRHRCPACHKSDGLWEATEVTVGGWRGLDEYLEPNGESETDDFDVLSGPYPTGQVGCSQCDWRSWLRDDLEAVGIDGEPLPVVHPNQMQIEAAA